MLDWNKKLPHAVATPEEISVVTLQEAADYAERKSSPSWQWARRQLTRAALSDDDRDLAAALVAVQNAIFLDGMRGWSGRKSA
jgi:hypothetical protein